jgi:catechol 2,3-dioxygenase-like lactoylglutathione lyase family enzyme
MAEIPASIGAITLFVDDLAEARAFYLAVFGLPVHFEDDASVVFKFGPMLVNLLDVREAPELVAPAPVADGGAGIRFQLTIEVDDVDAAVAEVVRRGATLLNGPIDRPWGIRTAAFRDPAGHVWELAS